MSSLPPALGKFFQIPLQKSLKGSQKNLYQVLGGLPRDGVGSLVSQSRWASKGIQGCFYYITRVKLKTASNHGKAWGILFWNGKDFICFLASSWATIINASLVKGKPLGERKAIEETKIPGSLKYAWKHVPYNEVGWKGIEEELRLSPRSDRATRTTSSTTKPTLETLISWWLVNLQWVGLIYVFSA